MSKKRFFIAFLMMLALVFTTLVGCDMGTPSTSSTSVKESVSVSTSISNSNSGSYNESTSEKQSASAKESASESKKPSSDSSSNSQQLTVPTFSLDVTSTETTVTFVVEENDPDNVGEITYAMLQRGGTKIVLEDLSLRTFEGLYSGVQYNLYVTYEYDVGQGKVSKTTPKTVYTKALTKPTLEISYDSTSENSISFDLNITDESNILKINAIKLVSDKGDEIALGDLTARIFENIPSGTYELVVEYEFDLNKGQAPFVVEEKLAVSTKIDPLSIPDFIVHVDEGRDPVILQISDPQIIDATQVRPGESADKDYHSPAKINERFINYLNETVNAVKPDLILVTGDLVYGKFDDNGSSLLRLIDAMESFGIPWAPVFGNHDNESKMGVDWQCEQLEKATNCLFKQRTLSGNGNYTVGIEQGGKLTRVFFMMDTNGCGEASAESLANGHTYKNFVGFKQDQIDWFMGIGKLINKHSPDTKVSFAFHIQLNAFKDAFKSYGFPKVENNKYVAINIDWHEDKKEGDFGYLGANLKGPWDPQNTVFNQMVEIGCDSIYVGHEHLNNASAVYNGVRFQFSQKISMYDRYNSLMPSGEIVGGYNQIAGATPIMGGTVNVLGEDGSITDAYIYYCGGIDPTQPPLPILEVGGLKYGTSTSSDLHYTNDMPVSVLTKEIAGYNAYEVTALTQGKFRVNHNLLANKSTFTFSVYLPSTSSNLLGGFGEFAIRVKPNTNEPVIDSAVDGYIKFMSEKNKPDVLPELKLVYDEWVTYTIDISNLGTNCTEWAFVIAQGNVIYLRDIVIA